MLTPRFTLSQDDDAITAKIHAPYVKFSDGEMWLQGSEFSFYCKPYHLKLYFSGEITEDGTESAQYNVDAGTFTVLIPKANKGENFENLDMLTKLITPPQSSECTKAAAAIEVLSSSADPETAEEVMTKDIDWSVDQNISTEDTPGVGVTTAAFSYGFNLKDSGIFSKLQEESYELLDIGNPDETGVSQRSLLQLEAERKNFNADHYLADMTDDSAIQELIDYRTAVNEVIVDKVVYSEVEIEDLLKLPKKEYLLDSSQVKASLLSLIDILYACLYDQRTTMDEGSVESAWTIRKLSSTLSWLVCHKSVEQVLMSSVRRALCYPLYRHWGLAQRVQDDLYNVLHLGKQQVLKCLLYVYRTFNNTEPYHVLNRLYIEDLCVWVQSLPDGTLHSLAHQVFITELSKEDVQLGLVELERLLLISSDSESADSETEDSESGESGTEDNDVDSVDETANCPCGDTLEDRVRMDPSQTQLDSDDSSDDESVSKVTSNMDKLTV